MSSDALAIVAGVAFLLAVLAVVFIPLLIIAKKNRKKGRRGGGDSNLNSSMNDINNLNF